MIRLLPCPFCGATPLERVNHADIGGAISRFIYIVECVNVSCIKPKSVAEGECGYPHMDVRTNAQAKSLAINNWNHRINKP